MAMPAVHFAVGMGLASALGALLAAVRRRWLIYLPLLMTLGGLLALIPDLLSSARETPEKERLAFHAIVLAYFAAACGYVAYIRWGLPRVPESAAALARLRRAAASYRAAAPLAGVAPLVLLGAMVGGLVRTAAVPQPSASALGELEQESWSRLVQSRMRVAPGPHLGIVRALPWPGGEWVVGDLGAHTALSGGSVALADLVERARAAGCGFVVLADGAGPRSPDQEAAYRQALDAARKKFPDVALLRGPVRGALRWLESEESPSAAFLASAAAQGDGWGDVYSWLRTNEAFVGIVGLREAERLAAPPARGRWDWRVAEVGGLWDQFLSRGYPLACAGAASGFRDPKTHYWPGEFARTHVWCRGRKPADILAGLRAGCFWADEGGIVRSLDFKLMAPELERPARMGEVVRVAPDADVRVELMLNIPPLDFASRANRIDEVEVISNFAGEAKVLHTFRRVESEAPLRFTFPPAADRSGGLGFYVRARGRHRLADGSDLWFYTNPVRVLVREGLRPPAIEEPAGPARVAAAKKPEAAKPASSTPAKAEAQPSVSPAVAQRLAAIGLPRSVHPLHVETFEKAPGIAWRGTWAEHAPGRGAAMGDQKLEVRFLERIPLGPTTRLVFRCHATDCARITLQLYTSAANKPYQAVRELPDQRWADFDLSLADDFCPPPGAPSRLPTATELEALDWRGERSGPQAGFHVADVALYEPTAASRVERAHRRADQLVGMLRQLVEDSGASRAWRARAEAASARLTDCRARLADALAAAGTAPLGAVERDLDGLFEECRRLRLYTEMARTFALDDPPFVVGVESPARRVSATHPARRFDAELRREVELWAAGGEAESFQLVVLPLWEKLRAVEVAWSDLRPEGPREGPGLPASELSAAIVGELVVYPRADLPPDRFGPTPDPLIPLLPFDVEPGSLRSVLVTVRVPADLPPGDYRGTLTVRARGLEPVPLDLRLHRWDFALTEKHFPILGPVAERDLREYYEHERGVPEAQRRALYELLLSHRVDPIPLLGHDEGTDLADLAFCLERGLGLAVLHEAPSLDIAPGDAPAARAARLATRLWESGWGRRGALILPPAREGANAARYAEAVNALGRRWPALLLLAGGEGEPPPSLIATWWRRSLAVETPPPPPPDDVEMRRARNARREAWELPPGAPDYPQPNLTLASLPAEARLLPWLAWRYGVRGLLLGGVNRWDHNNSGDGLLIYPGPDGGFYSSLRLVALRDGAEDYECLALLADRALRLRERGPERHLPLLVAADQLLGAVETATGSLQAPNRDPDALAALRLRVGTLAERLEHAWRGELDSGGDLPAPPPRLTATAGDGQVGLAWAKSPDEKVAAYHAYRSGDPKAGFARINPAPIEALTYADRSARNDTRYYYFLRACRANGAEGPHSPVAQATPRPSPKVLWLPMDDLRQASTGAYRVALRLAGPGTSGASPLVRPQIDYRLADGAYDGFEEMTRQADGTWTFDIPERDWRRYAAKTLTFKVRLVDRQNREVAPAVEREEFIDSSDAPRP